MVKFVKMRASATPTFEEWMGAEFPEFNVDQLSAEQATKFRKMFDADTSGETEEAEEEEEAASLAAKRKTTKARASGRQIGTDGASADGAIEAYRAELLRTEKVNRLCASRATDPKIQEIYEKAIAGMDVRDVELAVMRAGRATPTSVSADFEDGESEVVEAALLVNAGMALDRVSKFFGPKVTDKITAKRYRGMSLVEYSDRLIRRAGVTYDGARNQAGHMEATREACNKLRAAGFTSMTLSNILENAMDKQLLTAYQAVETKWQFYCQPRSLNDFKIHSQYALDPLSVFQKVGSEGDFAQLLFGDRKYTLQADSYGVRFKIDYQTWRNDDLGSISNRIATIGDLSANTIDQVFHTLLMAGINNTAMFHANNKNYDATSSSAFSINGLTFAEKMWDNQTRPNGSPLGVSPQSLMVGSALKNPAGQVFTSTKLAEIYTTPTAGRKDQAPTDNPYVGKYTPTMDPYLNNTLLKDSTSGKATAFSHQDDGLWLMLAKQGNNAPFHIGFLDGNQSPRVETINNQTEMIGFELAAGMHFGVGYGDPRLAMCFNPNAA